jgi:hypothetical protein
MPKYLVEIILIVKAKNPQEARKIADYIIDQPIPDKKHRKRHRNPEV